ncbi:MAG: hypothetical protein ACJAVV_000130 [Alphaproteobacteria bacterium]|jgi:hypothetical protein
MKPFKASFVLIVVSLFSISSCSTTQQAYLRNIEMYFESGIDVTLSNDEISQSTSDLIYVKNGDRSTVTMALGFIENGQYKWLSRDGVMLITENGRLVRTIGLEHNLLYVSNLSSDPLRTTSPHDKERQWDRVIDTEYGEYGVSLSSQTFIATNEVISVQTQQLVTNKYVESVHYQSQKHGEHQWTNTFWFHQASGQLLKSSQKLSSQSETLEITYLSRAIRLMEN